MQQNERDGSPLQIFNTTYSRGLFVDGLRNTAVHLASPGKSFDAVVGLDGHYNGCGYTNGKRVFSVVVQGEKKYQSPAIEVRTPGSVVHAALGGGTTEFALEESNGKGERWCGEAVWANARVTLENGKTLWLGDLPVVPLNRSFSATPPFSFTYRGRSSSEFLKRRNLRRRVKNLDAHRTEYDLTYTDPKTGLVVRCVAVAYHDFPTGE